MTSKVFGFRMVDGTTDVRVGDVLTCVAQDRAGMNVTVTGEGELECNHMWRWKRAADHGFAMHKPADRPDKRPSLNDIFRAGFVQRWHTNPELSRTGDRIDGHSARVARIILAFHPEPSMSLIRAALTHDDGEAAVGDVKAPAKMNDPVLCARLEQAERAHRQALWGDDPELTEDERLWLKFADRLDAYMWAVHHAPWLAHRPEWKAAFERLQETAAVLEFPVDDAGNNW